MFKYLVLASVLAVTGCKKKEEPTPAPTAALSGSGAAGSAAGSDTGSAAGSAAEGSAAAGSAAAGSGSAVAETSADYISVFASHSKPKPDDPVEIKFEKFAVTKAAFDPANLEGGTAQFTLDLTSLKSPSAKRDGHLQTPDYLDVAKFATATIDIASVKKKNGNVYTADAKVSLHGVDKTYPVTFEAFETTPEGAVRIRGEHEFSRLDFGVGKPTTDANEGAGETLKFKLQLTLKKS